MRASGQERSRGKRRPTREILSRVALVAAARACSCVRKGAPLFWSAALPTLTMVADEPEPLPTTPRRAPRFEVSIGRSGRPPAGRSSDKADLPGVSKVILKVPLHLRGESGIVGQQV
jgi:hypothetical protein